MPYWLAASRRGQETAFIKRFAAPFWTVNFPRPMMAGVVTTAPDALRVECAFMGSGDLAGLIWEAEDRWDHPLLAYETSRDFRACTLQFRWRSFGLKALDGVHGPTLTIEGRDADGRIRRSMCCNWRIMTG